MFRLIDVNPAYLEFTGYSREALIGTDPIVLQPEEDRASSRAARALLEAALDTEASAEEE